MHMNVFYEEVFKVHQGTISTHHLGVPLCFVCSRLVVGCLNSCWDRVVGWKVRATWPSKRTLQTLLFQCIVVRFFKTWYHPCYISADRQGRSTGC